MLPSLSLIDSLLLVCFCALVVHGMYNKYEFEPTNFVASFLLLAATPFLSSNFVKGHFSSDVYGLLVTFGLFYFTLGLSIVLYRLSPLHPLAKYPGPAILKITKFAVLVPTFHGKQHIFFKKLHDQYGPCVRVGPNEVSIADVSAVRSVFAVDGTRKGPQYAAHFMPKTPPDLISIPDVNEHRERRKLWNHGFTTSALKDYQPILSNRVLQLAEQLNKRAGKGSNKGSLLDLAEWMGFFTYDVMGDLVFGGGFEFMRDGDTHGFKKILEQSLRAMGMLEHIPWISGVMGYGLMPANIKRFIAYGNDRINKRKEKGSVRRDMFYFITNEDKLEDVDVSPNQATNDIYAAITAGADTTSTILGGTFYYLLTHREVFRRLRAEVDAAFPLGEGDPLDSSKLAGMPYLNAVINETLRLQPAVPIALQRAPLKGSGGKMVANWFLPENAAIYVPPYVLHRDPRYFSPSPDSFIPERWLSGEHGKQKKFTTSSSAFIPFSMGPASCAGKNLALTEMRMVLATLMQRFDFRLAGEKGKDGEGEGETVYDPSQWEEELRDHFVFKVGKLPVALTTRE